MNDIKLLSKKEILIQLLNNERTSLIVKEMGLENLQKASIVIKDKNQHNNILKGIQQTKNAIAMHKSAIKNLLKEYKKHTGKKLVLK